MAEPERLSPTAREEVDRADRLGVSAVSCFELSTQVRRGRIALDRDTEAWIGQALAHRRVVELPVTGAIAAEAGSLGDDFPGDPGDRIIYATARASRSPLVTKDAALRRYDERRAVW